MLRFGNDLLGFLYPFFLNQIFVSCSWWVGVIYSGQCRGSRGYGGQRRQNWRGLRYRSRIAGRTTDVLFSGLLPFGRLGLTFRLIYSRKSLTPAEVSRTVLW